jgi:hypothetical protein
LSLASEFFPLYGTHAACASITFVHLQLLIMTSESNPNQPVETWNGSCQCGNVKFTLNMYSSLYDGDTTSCNCMLPKSSLFLFLLASLLPKSCLTNFLHPQRLYKSIPPESQYPAFYPHANPWSTRPPPSLLPQKFSSAQPSTAQQNLGSICTRKGYLFIYPENANITWHSGKDTLKSYTFAAKKIGHRFCPECGTSVCASSEVEGFFEGITALNVSPPRPC